MTSLDDARDELGRVEGLSPDDIDALLAHLGFDLSDEVLARSLAAWTGLLGHISYVLFGHLRNGITDEDAFFEHQLARSTAELLGR